MLWFRTFRFDQNQSEVNIKYADGSLFAGAVVVGADGVHSVI